MHFQSLRDNTKLAYIPCNNSSRCCIAKSLQKFDFAGVEASVYISLASCARFEWVPFLSAWKLQEFATFPTTISTARCSPLTVIKPIKFFVFHFSLSYGRSAILFISLQSIPIRIIHYPYRYRYPYQFRREAKHLFFCFFCDLHFTPFYLGLTTSKSNLALLRRSGMHDHRWNDAIVILHRNVWKLK